MTTPDETPQQDRPPTQPEQASQAETAASTRRSLAGPLIALAAAAACLWASSRMTWAEVTASGGLGGDRTIEFVGGTWFGALAPLALTLVAAIAAAFAARGWLRRVLGVVVALIGVAAVPPVALLAGTGATEAKATRLAELRTGEEVAQLQTYSFPAVLALIGAVLAFVAGVLLTRKPSTEAALGAKYDAPASRRADATRRVAEADAAEPGRAPGQLSERTLWDALDAGEDPTAGRDDKDDGGG